MEANIKENQLTFSKGMSNVPSGNLCEDNTLSDCVGLRMKDGELRAVQEAKSYGTLDGELYYVHKAATYRHLIYRKDDMLYWAESDENGIKNIDSKVGEDNEQLSSVGVRKITSIGNTLIISTEAGMKYAVWKDGNYKQIEKFPEIILSAKRGFDYLAQHNGNIISYNPVTDKDELTKVSDNLKSSDRNVQRSEIIGMIEAANTKAISDGYFTFPFYLRAAIKLYDGTYTKLTPPLLVFPTVRRGAFAVMQNNNGNYEFVGANAAASIDVNIKLTGTRLDFNDIIDGVALFMSEPLKTYEDVEWDDRNINIVNGNETIYDYIDENGDYQSYQGNYASDGNKITAFHNKNDASYAYILPYYEKTDKEIMDQLLTKAVFYKIADKINCSYEGEDYADVYTPLRGLVERHVLENLTTQEQLEHDDYYSHCGYKPKIMYAFNNRLQCANIERVPWGGKYSPNSYDIKKTTKCYVEIEGNSGKMYPQMEITTSDNNLPVCFYYPDPRAKYVIFGNGTKIKLQSHPRLNGSYYFKCLPPNTPQGDDNEKEAIDDTWESKHPVSSETLPTEIMTSEVNNPWVFNAEGDNTVGTGEIIGIVSNTRALSQGQFGQYPLIVFTTEGIYALGTNSEGLYSTNTPLSREVCNNADSITPTDGAVFFTSEKGLMMMVGSDITCVSQQMMGKTDNYSPDSLYDNYSREDTSFYDFLKKCKIAYDYRDYCLYIYNDNFPSYCYVYDIKSGAITRKAETGVIIDSIVNDYPDNLLQDSDGVVWSLLNKSNMNYDTNAYDGMLLSRPVKFGDAQTLKSVRQIKHVMDINDKATLELHIYVSNDLKHWGEVKSLRGSGWKYFRFGLKFSNLKATDSYSGMICITQNRRTDKLR